MLFAGWSSAEIVNNKWSSGKEKREQRESGVTLNRLDGAFHVYQRQELQFADKGQVIVTSRSSSDISLFVYAWKTGAKVEKIYPSNTSAEKIVRRFPPQTQRIVSEIITFQLLGGTGDIWPTSDFCFASLELWQTSGRMTMTTCKCRGSGHWRRVSVYTVHVFPTSET